MTDKSESLLGGLKVIELSHIMAAPTCGQLLADMGADVVKVERLPAGDDTRRFGKSVDGDSAAFSMMNRNKRGLALNLKTDSGRAALRRLRQRRADELRARRGAVGRGGPVDRGPGERSYVARRDWCASIPPGIDSVIIHPTPMTLRV